MGALSMFVDTTQHRNSEQALRKSEEKYRLLFTTVQEGFTLNQVIYNEHHQLVDLRVLEANPAVEIANGIRREDFARQDLAGNCCAGGRKGTGAEVCDRVMRTGQEVVYENYAVH